MRKGSKNKKKTCSLCKPHKRGKIRFWKNKDFQNNKEFESIKKNLVNVKNNDCVDIDCE